MFLKIIVSILFLGVSFLIYRMDKKMPVANAVVFVILGITTFAVYRWYDGVSITKTSLVFALIYSMALIMLIFIMKGVTYILRNRYQKIENQSFIDTYKKVVGFLKREAIIILTTIYQILVIWNPSILGSINI